MVLPSAGDRHNEYGAGQLAVDPPILNLGEVDVALAFDLADEAHRCSVYNAHYTLKLTHQELERTSALIENLMTLARADSGNEALQVTSTSLNDILREISEPARLLAEGKSIHYEEQLPETPLPVSGNAAFLRRLFLILIDNAVKYTPSGGRISVVLDVNDSSAVTEIRDSGIGMSPFDLPHIFERFYRADTSRSRESGGSGLGLSIAKWITDAHRGNITVASRVGEGSIFRVHIPLVDSRSPQFVMPSPAR
jgi:two-component system sensor histidine kinase CiaH